MQHGPETRDTYPAGPAHAHDCDRCRFLGSTAPLDAAASNADDLYVCAETVDGKANPFPTLVRRWSSRPEDYLAMTDDRDRFAETRLDDPKYGEAVRLAFPELIAAPPAP